MYFFRVPKSPKLSIFLGLGLSSTFGPPRHILIGVPPLGRNPKVVSSNPGLTTVLCPYKQDTLLNLLSQVSYVNYTETSTNTESAGYQAVMEECTGHSRDLSSVSGPTEQGGWGGMTVSKTRQKFA